MPFTVACSASILAALMNTDEFTSRSDRPATTRSSCLARVDGSPAATAAAFFDRNVVGLYSFTTRESMRGRGLASALIRASHAVASARGIEQALLQATPAARSVYARAGYVEEHVLPVLTFP
jgi:GNAT superfamily N-acetyltransferase